MYVDIKEIVQKEIIWRGDSIFQMFQIFQCKTWNFTIQFIQLTIRNAEPSIRNSTVYTTWQLLHLVEFQKN